MRCFPCLAVVVAVVVVFVVVVVIVVVCLCGEVAQAAGRESHWAWLGPLKPRSPPPPLRLFLLLVGTS